jgi:hypothetical protein
MLTTENTQSTEKNSVFSVLSMVNDNVVNDKLQGLATFGKLSSTLGKLHAPPPLKVAWRSCINVCELGKGP